MTSTKWESRVVWMLFLVLWTYIFLRAVFVFFVHDEIVTMWSYMIEWNPIPYHGYEDANNHFLNSFLGGLFMRLFHSDSLFVVRLANVLAFPIYFWSVNALRYYFSSRLAFYGLFTTLLFSPFLIEYFGLARGYGLSLAFLVLAFLQMMRYFDHKKATGLIGTVLAWLLAVYSNLTLLPFALLALVYLLLFQFIHNKYKWMALPILAFLPLLYLLKYTFHLKEMGKLYYGEASNFIETTVHSLTYYLWHTENYYLDGLLVALFVLILSVVMVRLVREKNLFAPTNVFSLFLVASIVAIFAQNWLLEVNFPEDRTGLYLVVFFFGGLFFTFDYLRFPWASYPIILTTVLFLAGNTNLTHSIFWKHEHLDKELLTKIPDDVMGIPPSTSGRWTMEHELSRRMELPMRIFQNADLESDTLSDYVLSNLERRPDLGKYYHIIHKDPLSNQTLFERNVFLNRVESFEEIVPFNGNDEFMAVCTTEFSKPVFVVVEGIVNGLSMQEDGVLVFSSEDTVAHEHYAYQGISLVQNARLKNGRVNFKVTYAMNKDENANKLSVYLWNNKRIKLEGELRVEIFEILP